MKFTYFTVGAFESNAYILGDERTKTAVVIDAGGNADKIINAVKGWGYTLSAILLTHGHFDHAGACAYLQKNAGAKIYISEADAPMCNTSGNLAEYFGLSFERFKPDLIIKDGDTLSFGDIVIKVISTPGHTAGSLSFLTGDKLFTGDTLFRLSRGRTDFPSGDATDIILSIKKLFALLGDYTVYPGHYECTTLDYEREHNTARL